MRRSLIVLAAALLLPASAGAAVRVTPPVAAPGAAVVVSGPGLKKGVTVRIGGKRARVLSVSRARARVVVPKLRAGRAAVVVRRGRRTQRGRMTIARRFTGSVGVAVDARLARTQTIGPDGGTVAVTRGTTTFTLTVPAGALAAATEITLTPVTRLTGLPLSGTAAAVRFAPEGLAFATPATLRIDGAPRGTLVGFDATSTGASFDVLRARRDGRRAEIAVEHFSTAGVASGDPADFAAAVAPIVNSLGNLTEGQIQTLVNLVGVWDVTFPGFCATQPVCGTAIDKARTSLAALVPSRCTTLKLAPTRLGVAEMFRLNGFGTALGLGENTTATDCALALMTSVMQAAINAVTGGDPLGQSGREGEISAAAFPGADLDGAGSITHFEWLVLVATDANLFGHFDLGQQGTAAIETGFDRIRTQSLEICETDRFAGRLRLEKGRAYAQRMLIPTRQEEFARALDACRTDVTVTPANPTIATGSTQQFTATVTSDLNTAVTWSASGGTIDAGGLYTAPSLPGSYVVTATSVANPNRKGTATVTVTCPAGSCGPQVSLGNRQSSIESNASASVPETVSDPHEMAFTGAGLFDEEVNSRAENSNQNGTGATALAFSNGAQNSNVVVSDTGLVISAGGDAGAEATDNDQGSASGEATAASEMTVTFTLGKPHSYSMGIETTVPAGGAATVTVTGPNGPVAEGQGTLPAGSYSITANVEAHATSNGTPESRGGWDLSLNVTA